MRVFIGSLGLALLLAWAGEARAESPLKLQLQIRPAAHNSELLQLMKQNSARVYQQRMRLWQRAAREDGSDSGAKGAMLRHRYRHRHRTGTAAAGDKAPTTAAAAAKGTGDKSQLHHRIRARTGKATMAGPATQGSLKGLRSLLRKGRTSTMGALDQQLARKLREQRRLKEQQRARERQRHRTGKGQGGRSGR